MNLHGLGFAHILLGSAVLLAPTQALPQAGARERPDVVESTRRFHAHRLDTLKAEDGWLTLVGLLWLHPGANTFGSAADNDLVFPANAPAHAGTFTLEGKQVRLEAAAGTGFTLGGAPVASRVLASDAAEKPDVVRRGTLSFLVIERQGRVGLRLKDTESRVRKEFHDIPTYPADARFRVEAQLKPGPEHRTVVVPNVLGTPEAMSSPGTLFFMLAGKELQLTPVQEPGDDRLFIIFGDLTNRDATYGAGRFLYAKLPSPGGTVTLDFNQAYNPPCAFTAFATCPIPPPENRLKVRVEAGERRYGGH